MPPGFESDIFFGGAIQSKTAPIEGAVFYTEKGFELGGSREKRRKETARWAVSADVGNEGKARGDRRGSAGKIPIPLPYREAKKDIMASTPPKS